MHIAQVHQAPGPRVDETGREDAALLVIVALGEQATSGLEAGRGKLVEPRGLRGVAVNFALARVVGHAGSRQPDARGNHNARQEQMDGRRPVRAAQLDGLRVVRKSCDERLVRVRVPEH